MAVGERVGISVFKGFATALSSVSGMTDCPIGPLLLADLGHRGVVVECTGGVLLLRQVNPSLGVYRTLATCLHDTREARFVDHTLPQLLAQRLDGLALDHNDLDDQAPPSPAIGSWRPGSAVH